jgi:hypothetical protein
MAVFLSYRNIYYVKQPKTATCDLEIRQVKINIIIGSIFRFTQYTWLLYIEHLHNWYPIYLYNWYPIYLYNGFPCARNKPFSTRTEELSTVEVTVKYVRFR